MSVFDQSIRSFLTDASSASPTPGGGSVAALAASLGASMTAMVANVSLKKATNLTAATLDKLATEMTVAIANFEQLFDDDMAAFDNYMAAFRMPRTNAVEIEQRKTALQKAAVTATEVPLRLAKTCLDAIRASAAAIETATPFVLSDLGIAVMLLETAGQSALLTANGNIQTLTDAADREGLRQRQRELEDALLSVRNTTMDALKNRMSV